MEKYCPVEKLAQLDPNVIAEILETYSVGFDETIHRPYYSLAYGSKQIRFYTSRDGSFNSQLTTISGVERFEHETTYLYSAAKQLFQRVAERKGEVVRYQISTVDHKLRQWMKNVGEPLFNTQTYHYSQFLCMDVEFTPRVDSK